MSKHLTPAQQAKKKARKVQLALTKEQRTSIKEQYLASEDCHHVNFCLTKINMMLSLVNLYFDEMQGIIEQWGLNYGAFKEWAGKAKTAFTNYVIAVEEKHLAIDASSTYLKDFDGIQRMIDDQVEHGIMPAKDERERDIKWSGKIKWRDDRITDPQQIFELGYYWGACWADAHPLPVKFKADKDGIEVECSVPLEVMFTEYINNHDIKIKGGGYR